MQYFTVGWQSRATLWQVLAISAFSAVSTMSASNFCRNLGLQIGQSWHSQQPQNSRHFWLAVLAISTSLALSGDTLGDVGTFARVGNLSTLSNLGLQFGQSWHYQQAQKSRHSWLAISAISTSSTISGVVLGYMGTFAMVGNLRRNLGLQFWQFRHSQQPGKTAILAGSLGNIDKLSNVN